jgi:hypothetical protein
MSGFVLLDEENYETAKGYVAHVLDIAKENCHSPQDAFASIIEFLNKAIEALKDAPK